MEPGNLLAPHISGEIGSTVFRWARAYVTSDAWGTRGERIGVPPPAFSFKSHRSLPALRCRHCETLVVNYGPQETKGQWGMEDKSWEEKGLIAETLQSTMDLKMDVSKCPTCKEEMEAGILIVPIRRGFELGVTWRWAPPGVESLPGNIWKVSRPQSRLSCFQPFRRCR